MADADLDRIDGNLRDWQQGDVIHQEEVFVHLADLSCPLTSEAFAAGDEVGADKSTVHDIYTTVPGLVVLSQTCDIVRSCRNRHFVEVAPLIKANQTQLKEVKKGYIVNRAYVAGIAEYGLVADLDRRMTVEKSLLAKWPRIKGCRTDAEVRDFRKAVSRKLTRAAFPKDFSEPMGILQKRIKKIHGRNSDEGKMLDSLAEIRVCAIPSWNHDAVTLRFLFIKDDGIDYFEKKWRQQCDDWLDSVKFGARFTVADPEIGRLEDFTARDYVESDQLDLDNLSLA